MRISKIMLIVIITLVMSSVSVVSLSCASSESEPIPQNQIATVQRGNLTIDITASGNLALSVTEGLPFEIAGTVDEVLVEEGDAVEKGQVLAKLDTSGWEDQITTLEVQVTSKKRDLLSLRISAKQAELNLENALNPVSTSGRNVTVTVIDPLDIEMKELGVELAQGKLEDAQKAVDDAQKALDDAKSTGPVITAPFAGFITRVNVSGGADIKKGTVAVTLADPNKFEADILVNETNIMQVKLGGDASVGIDAMQGLSIPAKVTHISPTATIQQGVVNYNVKVELESLQALMQERQQAIQQRQQAQGGQSQQAQSGQSQVPTAIPENFQLRQGLTVTVSIIVQQKTDVLLVPNGAITTQGRQTYVRVISATGTAEQRAITTGISNWQYTEVTNGLTEDEKVVSTQGTATTTTTSQQRPAGGMFIPGVGRVQ